MGGGSIMGVYEGYSKFTVGKLIFLRVWGFGKPEGVVLYSNVKKLLC